MSVELAYQMPPENSAVVVVLQLFLIATTVASSHAQTHYMPPKHDCPPGWLPIIFGCLLLFMAWLANCTLIGGVLQVMSKPGVVKVAYYFVGSQATMALLYVTLNLPPGLLILLFGSTNMNSYLGIFCLFSVYLDTLFCNLALLHAFSSGLDSFLRLSRTLLDNSEAAAATAANHKPERAATAWLKIGGPWFVSGLLATVQLAVSDRGMTSLSGDCSDKLLPAFTNQLEATCLITDPNFLILRTSIAYALPLIGCFVLTGLQVRCLRRLKFVAPRVYPLGSRQRPQTIRRDVTLETLAPVAETGKLSHSNTLETVHECPRHGRVAYTADSVLSDEYRSTEQEHSVAVAAVKWYRAYRGEQLAVAINMVSCIVAVGVWSPLILSSLAYGLCHVPESQGFAKQPLYRIPGIDLSKYRPSKCFIQVVDSRLADFRWWVYASTGLLLPIALLLMDRDLRRACWKSLGLQPPPAPMGPRKPLRSGSCSGKVTAPSLPREPVDTPSKSTGSVDIWRGGEVN